jgi:tripartite-type tricarboxylate transporter receptor subunit TctC
VQQLWAKQGAMPMVMSPQVFDQYIRDDIAKWARVIQSAHIKVD